MKATQYGFDQIAHFRVLAEQKGVPPERLQEHYKLGAIADVLEIPDPKKITPEMRDAARQAYGLPPLNPPLLEPIGTIIIPALTGRFSANEKFVLNYGSQARPGVCIADLDSNFKAWFGEVIEEPTAEAVVGYARLTHSSVDGPIIVALGSHPDLTIFLCQIYWLMEQQPNGEDGALLTNSWANIFYMPGLLRAVLVRWFADDGGWSVGADSVEHPDGWIDSDRVFSRNSLVAVTP